MEKQNDRDIYLSVIIPAYNEEKRLPKTLKEIAQYLLKQNYQYEIIAVNDGSRDRTSEIVKCLKPEIKHLQLIDNVKNNGKGYVVRQGMLAARGKYRVFTDADNSTSIDQIEKLWPEFKKNYDVVIGSRDIKGAVIAVPQSWVRRRLGDIFNLLVQVMSGLWGIWDTQCGFKGFTAEAAEEIFSRAKLNRFAFDVEVLVLAKKLGYKIKEVPVVWINAPDSRVKFKSMLKMLLEVFEVKWNLINREYD